MFFLLGTSKNSILKKLWKLPTDFKYEVIGKFLLAQNPGRVTEYHRFALRETEMPFPVQDTKRKKRPPGDKEQFFWIVFLFRGSYVGHGRGGRNQLLLYAVVCPLYRSILWVGPWNINFPRFSLLSDESNCPEKRKKDNKSSLSHFSALAPVLFLQEEAIKLFFVPTAVNSVRKEASQRFWQKIKSSDKKVFIFVVVSV